MYTFGELLRGFRRREGLSQETLADKLGVHRNSISDWERNAYLPRTRQMVLDLSEALDLDRQDANQLLYAAEYPLMVDPQDNHDAVLAETAPESELLEEPAATAKSVFVAREDELDQLNGFLAEVLQEQQGRVVFVNGEAGSGKTALVQEFCWRALEDNADLVVAGGSCNAYIGIGDPYLPFREILALLTYDMEVRWAAEASVRNHASRLRSLVPNTVRALLQHGPDLIDTFLSGPALIKRASAISSQTTDWIVRLKTFVARRAADRNPINPQQHNLFAQYTRVLRFLSRQKPLLLVLDDLQWADNGSIGLLFNLGKRLEGRPILLIGVYRSADVALGREGQRHPLEPLVNEFQLIFGDNRIDLKQTLGQQFIEAFLDTEPNRLGDGFKAALYERTQGHALFTIEMLRSMQRRGDLIQDEHGRWTEGPSLDWETLPARIDGVIRERIDRLPKPLIETLKVASVEGEDFTAEAVAWVQHVDAWAMARQLSSVLDKKHRLVRSQIIRRLGDQRLSHYRFQHILFQHYLYSGLDEVEQAFLHEKVGNTLEHLYAGHTEAIAVQLARHFQKAQLNAKAIDYLGQAGRRALSLSANEEAVAHFSEALALIKTLPDNDGRAQQELDLQIGLGPAQIAILGYAATPVEKTYLRARELCHRVGSTRQLFQVLAGLWVCYFVRGDLQRARQHGRQLLELAKEEKNPVVFLQAHRTLGATLCSMGEFTATLAHCEQGIALYKIQQLRYYDNLVYGQDPGVVYLSYLSIAQWFLGFPQKALNRSREAISLAHELDHPFSLAFALGMAAFVHHFLRQEQSVLNYAESALQLSTAKGFAQWIVPGMILRGWALIHQGQGPAQLDSMRQALDNWQATGANLVVPYFLLILAEAYARNAQIDAGLTALSEALSAAQSTGERWLEAEIHRLRGELMLERGEAEAQVEACFSRALDVAGRQKAKSLELRILVSLSRLRQRQGRRSEALKMLTASYNWFTEGFETPDLRDAKALIDELLR